MGERAQVQQSEVSFVPKNVQVSSTDTYVKPAPISKEQVFSPLGEFLVNLSPTLAEYGKKVASVREELKTQAILESMAPKSVEDIDAMFKDPESFNKYADAFNSMTLQGQQNMGKILGVKYAEEAKLAIQAQAIEENWHALPPPEYADKVYAATKALLAARKETNPNAFLIPNFTSQFSTAMEEHNNLLKSQHIQEFGQFFKATTEEQMKTIALNAASAGRKDFQTNANEIAQTIAELWPTAKSLDINRNITDGIIASRNIPLMQAMLDGKAVVKYGDKGQTLNGSFEFRDKISKAIRQVKVDDMDMIHKKTEQYSLITRYADQIANDNLYGSGQPLTTTYLSAQMEAAGKPVNPASLKGIVRSTNKRALDSFNSSHPLPLSQVLEKQKEGAYILATYGSGTKEMDAFNRSLDVMNHGSASQIFIGAQQVADVRNTRSFVGVKAYNNQLASGAAQKAGQMTQAIKLQQDDLDRNGEQFLSDMATGSYDNPYFMVLPAEEQRGLMTMLKGSRAGYRSNGEEAALVQYWQKALGYKKAYDRQYREERKAAEQAGAPVVKTVTISGPALGYKPGERTMDGSVVYSGNKVLDGKSTVIFDPVKAGKVTVKQVPKTKKYY